MFKLTGYNGSLFSVLDTSDGVTESVSIEQVKRLLSNGIEIAGLKLNPSLNPMWSIDGIEVTQVFYPCSYVFNQFTVCVLRPGERYGRTLSAITDKLSVHVYQHNGNFSQFCASYYFEDFVKHKADLVFDMSQPDWKIPADLMKKITNTLQLLNNRGDFYKEVL